MSAIAQRYGAGPSCGAQVEDLRGRLRAVEASYEKAKSETSALKARARAAGEKGDELAAKAAEARSKCMRHEAIMRGPVEELEAGPSGPNSCSTRMPPTRDR